MESPPGIPLQGQRACSWLALQGPKENWTESEMCSNPSAPDQPGDFGFNVTEPQLYHL